MNISDSLNNGFIMGSGSFYGGFVGHMRSNANMTMTISNCINNETVSANMNAGGLVGNVYSSDDSHSMSLSIINCENKGSVFEKGGMACGMVCVDSGKNHNINTTIINSINKGSVNASVYGYGVTNTITLARNVVSMGKVTGSSGSYTFWNASTDVSSLYGLYNKCLNTVVKIQCSSNSTQTHGSMKRLGLTEM